MAESGSLTVYPGAYDASLSRLTGSGISNANNPVGKGPDNLVFANIHANNSVRPVYVSWPFDVSSIPRNAVINSVVCNATASMSSVSSVSLASMQLYSGTVAKGDSVSFKSTTQSTYSINGQGWTREELASVCLRLTVDTSASQVRNARFYGANLTVTYTYQNEKFMLKLGGKYNDVARVFKKVSGIWVEQEELADVVDQTKRLVNGGEYVVELPEGYTRLEYIESTGNQYIDTNFIPDSNTRVVYDFEVVQEPSATLKIFAARTSSTYQFCFAVVPGSGYRTDYGGTRVSIPATVLGRHRVDKDKNVTTLDGTAFTNDAQVFSTGYSLILFGQNDSGTINELTTYRLYGCRIYDNGTLIRDMKPCLSPDATPGLYDIVNDVFYGSATTTDFASPGGTSEIVFSIAGVTYKGYMGMTFGEWVASSYNTAGYYFNSSGYLASSAGNNYVSEPGTKAEYVESTTEIVSGRAYKHIIVAG